MRPLGRDAGWCPGCCATDEVAEATGFPMPPGEYETLAGLVLARLGRIPDVGETWSSTDGGSPWCAATATGSPSCACAGPTEPGTAA